MAATYPAEQAELLRGALSQFATGVTVVTTVSADGRPVGTTATAVASLSLDPPLVLVCLGRESSTRLAIHAHGAFAINVLGEGDEKLSANFARRGGEASWRECEHGLWPSGCPRLGGALASVDCAVEEVLDGGDHEIVIGRVRDAGADHGPRRPLLHWRGRYAGLEPR